jgi:hypothetical protein
MPTLPRRQPSIQIRCPSTGLWQPIHQLRLAISQVRASQTIAFNFQISGKIEGMLHTTGGRE